MAKDKKIKKRNWWLLGILIAATVAVLGGGGSLLVVNRLEEQSSFCASCHTEPESTFFSRTTAASAVDLASVHAAKGQACITCHSGPGTSGRLAAEMDGAQNAFLWITHTAVQPGKLRGNYPDANCLKCHADVPTTQDFNRHFHAFLAKWQAMDPNAATCVDCHPGHTTDGLATQAFLSEQRVVPYCEACHKVAGAGG